MAPSPRIEYTHKRTKTNGTLGFRKKVTGAGWPDVLRGELSMIFRNAGGETGGQDNTDGGHQSFGSRVARARCFKEEIVLALRSDADNCGAKNSPAFAFLHERDGVKISDLPARIEFNGAGLGERDISIPLGPSDLS